jgi:hypothetical protein
MYLGLVLRAFGGSVHTFHLVEITPIYRSPLCQACITKVDDGLRFAQKQGSKARICSVQVYNVPGREGQRAQQW